MSPGPVHSASRGGYTFSRSQTFGPRNASLSRHAYEPPFGQRRDISSGRTGDPGQRNRFAVTGSNGGHDIALGDNELARVTTDADGNLTIEITNQPASGPAVGGDGGAGAGAGGAGAGNGSPAAQTEPMTASMRRGFAGQRNRMSWERDPTSGGAIIFTPSDGETLDVDGDAIQAVVTAHPSPGAPNG